jgi:hypothetical protein
LTNGKYLRTEHERIPIGDAECALAQARNLGAADDIESPRSVTVRTTLDRERFL